VAEVFDSDWLKRRWRADHRARDNRLVEHLRGWASPRGRLAILDLGAGSGSNAGFMAPRLPAPQHWCLVDHDAQLLATAMDNLADLNGVTGAAAVADMARIDADWCMGYDVITAAALLDLAGADWLDRVIANAADVGAACLFALNYTGAIAWRPPLAGDDLARDAFNAHQRSDKGLGPALGPNAPAVTAATARRRGLSVERAASPWRLSAGDEALQAALLADRYQAAAAQAPDNAEELAAWAAARQTRIDSGDSGVVVGHEDLLVWPQ